MLLLVLGFIASVCVWIALMVLLGIGRDWIGRITGLSAWVTRARFRERQSVLPGSWFAASMGCIGALLTCAYGAALTLAPTEPWDRGTGLTVLGVGACLLVVAALLTIRWWRVSTYYLP